MVPILLAMSEASQSGASRTFAAFSPSGLIGVLASATSVSQSFFTACLI